MSGDSCGSEGSAIFSMWNRELLCRLNTYLWGNLSIRFLLIRMSSRFWVPMWLNMSIFSPHMETRSNSRVESIRKKFLLWEMNTSMSARAESRTRGISFSPPGEKNPSIFSFLARKEIAHDMLYRSCFTSTDFFSERKASHDSSSIFFFCCRYTFPFSSFFLILET